MTVAIPRLLAIAVVLLFATRIAAADDDDPDLSEAKRYFDRGQKAFAVGKFDDALEHYQKAYEAKPLPAFLFNIGQCYRNLGDFESAIFSFKKYLKLAPEAENRAEVEAYIDELEAERQKRNARKLRLDDKPRRDDQRDDSSPIYTTWWFWTGVAVVGVAGGVGIYAATRESGPPATTLDRNIEFAK